MKGRVSAMEGRDKTMKGRVSAMEVGIKLVLWTVGIKL